MIFVLLALAVVLIAGKARGDASVDHGPDGPAAVALEAAG